MNRTRGLREMLAPVRNAAGTATGNGFRGRRKVHGESLRPAGAVGPPSRGGPSVPAPQVPLVFRSLATPQPVPLGSRDLPGRSLRRRLHLLGGTFRHGRPL